MVDNYFVLNYFHIQMLFICLLFCLRRKRRTFFWTRFILGGAVYVLPPYYISGGYFNDWLRVGPWFTFGFFLVLVLLFLLVWGCFELSTREVLFYVCTAHTIQHMIHCFAHVWQLLLHLSNTPEQWVELLCGITIAVGSYVLLHRQLEGKDSVDLTNIQLLAFAIVTTTLIYVVSLWAVSIEPETVGLYLFDMLCCALLLIILFDMFQFRKMQEQNRIMLHLLKQEQRQNELSKASVELINRKCHDLKHQISALRHMNDPAQQEQSIHELEKAVLLYDQFAKTGNRDLDLLLAEKGMLCEQDGIQLRYMVEGQRLAFLQTDDLYSLIGNMLDNAIESVSTLADVQKRLITFQTTVRGNCLAVHMENPCMIQPRFFDGLPITTKADADYHGFGMRSIRYITEKYGGIMVAQCRDDVFEINLLFPGR